MTRRLDRREALAAFGTVSLGTVLAACGGDGDEGPARVTTEEGRSATVQPKTGSSMSDLFDRAATCTLTAQQSEGPYYFDVDSIRSDIREDRAGARLRLGIRVRDAGTCKPIEDAVVDVWHCDAEGRYSGFESDSDRTTFCRGAQVTNSDGIARFRTVYPGWYPGRTQHIHAKVHLDRRTVLTTQLYFADDVTSAVYRSEPYASRPERADLNESDALFDSRLAMTCARDGDADWGEAVLGAITLDVERA